MNWVTLRSDLEFHHAFWPLAVELGVTKEMLLAHLFRLSAWFHEHGKRGRIEGDPEIIDLYTRCPGLSAALMRTGWLVHMHGQLSLRVFCTTSQIRSPISKKVREEILGGASCVACGDRAELVIDHIVPFSKGGSNRRENLQALCHTCNVEKGSRSMAEFLASRAAAHQHGHP